MSKHRPSRPRASRPYYCGTSFPLAWVIASAALLACGGKKPATGIDPATTTGPGMAGIAACKSVVRAIDAGVACGRTPDLRELERRMSSRMREMMTEAKPLGERDSRMAARSCVRLLEGYSTALPADGCAFALSTQEVAWVATERARRTPIPSSADPASRASLTWLAGLRDRACKCKDVACYEAVEHDLDKPDNHPGPVMASDTAARDATGEMIDELVACGGRLTAAAARAMPPPQEPADPAKTRKLLEWLRAEDERDAVVRRPAAEQVRLRDGRIVRLADCKVLPSVEWDRCLGLFEAVEVCRDEPDAAKAVACERAELDEYMDPQADGEGGFEADEDEDQESWFVPLGDRDAKKAP